MEDHIKKEVEKCFTEYAEEALITPVNKYKVVRQISKWLCDYTLLLSLDLRGKKILNIGCSEPTDENYFIDIVEEWHALDINSTIIEAAKEACHNYLSPLLFRKLQFIVDDMTNLTSIESDLYDIVTCFSVIDRLPSRDDRVKAVREMHRVLKPNGYLVITVPNRWDLLYRYQMKKLQRSGLFPYEYLFSPLELKKIFVSNGFEVQKCASSSFNPWSYFDRILAKIGKRYLGTRFGYLATKT